MQPIPVRKLNGAGNDFIVIDERDCDANPSWLAERLCRRALSIGADGLILVAPEDGDVRVRFWNPDGSRAEMCGNGSRCAARDACDRGLVSGPEFRLLTDSGNLDARALPGDCYAVAMPEPQELTIDYVTAELGGETVAVHALRVGVPHAVVIVPDVTLFSDEEIFRLGRTLRYDSAFPHGTNVNVISRLPDGSLRQRTYERGVEALTKACGTGATGSATVAHALLGCPWPIEVVVDGGRLTIDARAGRPWLAGDARLVASGVVGPDAAAG